MARVTVEDCIEKVDNRFELVLLASHRARMISAGSPLTIDRDRDKNPVVALREIADSTILPEHLREDLINGLRKLVDDGWIEQVPGADDRRERRPLRDGYARRVRRARLAGGHQQLTHARIGQQMQQRAANNPF